MALNLARTVKAGDADPKVVQILTECLEFDTITENQAARRIDEYNKLDEDQYNLEDIWGAFFRASFHIPHDHPAQSRLVQILLELKELPSRTVQFGDKELIFWSGMPLFHGYFSEWWQFCGPFDRPMDEEGKSPEEIVEEASHEWQNFVSFSARLWKAGLIGLFRSSVYTLREALEDDTGELELKWRIAAASEWIVHCGASDSRRDQR
ncbi:hypothetical protein N7468_008879 [Penicillium chermesinum]|uniref:Uncharacterized protein n=1 Tax=Penicillium chermesinum TaxID=63820 RepID=A0A9W9NGP1_9EURO|nr:uncharacterized protein N7468_008879 [Penicillium chermesinum]KAJ5219675.1 hypothetical protein N7468_008879 [Penicillium chermesinum]